jgi:Spy/CpxP family protein refolding chaperone
MRKGLSVLASFAALIAVALPPCLGAEEVKVRPAGEEKRPRKARREKEESPFGKGAAFGDDLAQLDSQLTLTDEQKKKLQEIKEKRDKALEKYDQLSEKRTSAVEKRLEQVRGRKDREANNLRKQAEGFLKSVRAGRARLAAGYEKKMFAVLTPEQRAKWNTPVLTQAITNEFSLLFLEGKQEEKLQALCKAQAKRLSIPLDPEKHAEALLPIKRLVYRNILTKKQQAEYVKLKAPADKGGEGKRRRKG